MNEDKLLKSIFPLLNQGKDIITGPGDDCAVIDIGDKNKYLLIAADQIVSNVHFDPEITLPEEAGAKLLKRNISDIAAMGGRAAHAVVTIAVSNYDINWIQNFYKGLSDEANKWNISICGGDISSIKNVNGQLPQHTQMPTTQPLLVTTLTITGYVEKKNLCLRKNAKPGDSLFITGTFGNSYKSKHHLNFTPRVEEGNFLSSGFTDTMMDITDGLLIDLQRIAKASDITIKLDTKKIPLRTGARDIQSALTDGEDYELAFTVTPDKINYLVKSWPFKTKLTKIGKVIDKKKHISIIDKTGFDLTAKYKITGWDHLEN